MGRHLILACDNCIPGDASGWYLPLALAVVASLGIAALAWWRAATGPRHLRGRRSRLLWAGGLALLLGPPAAVYALMSQVTYDRAYCGSALSASLERARPGHVLDRYQSGCVAEGERIVSVARTYGVTSVAFAGLALAGAAVPSRRRDVPAEPPMVHDDGPAVEAVAASGVDLTLPVPLRHVLLVHDPAAAEALAAAVRDGGYDVRLDTHDGGWTWIVAASETAVLTAEHAATARARLAALAARHGAEYEGWDVAVP